MFRLVVFLFVLAVLPLSAEVNFNVIWSLELGYKIEHVAVSKDSKMILAQDSMRNVVILDADTKEILYQRTSVAKELFFSNDGKRLFGRMDSTICSYEIENWEMRNFELCETDIIEMSVSQDEKYIIGSTNYGFVVWDVESAKIIKRKHVTAHFSQNTPKIMKPRIKNDNSKIYLYHRYDYNTWENGYWLPSNDAYVLEYNFDSLDCVDTLDSRVVIGDYRRMFNYEISKDNSMYITVHVEGRSTSVYYLKNKMLYAWIYQFPFYENSKINFTTNNKNILVHIKNYNFCVYGIFYGLETSSGPDINFGTSDLSPDEKFIAAGSGSVLYKLLYNPTLSVDTEIPNPENIFPNPTSGVFNVAFDNPGGANVKAYLCDIIGTGQIPLFDDYLAAGSSTLQFSIGEYPTGNYLLKLYFGEVIRTYKVSLIK